MGKRYYVEFTRGTLVITSIGTFDTATEVGQRNYEGFLALQLQEDDPNVEIIRRRVRDESFDKIKTQTGDGESGVATAKGSMPGSIQDQHQKGPDVHAGVENVVIIHDKKKKKGGLFGN